MPQALNNVWTIGISLAGLAFGLCIMLFGAPVPTGEGDPIDKVVQLLYVAEDAWGRVVTILTGFVLGAACTLKGDGGGSAGG